MSKFTSFPKTSDVMYVCVHNYPCMHVHGRRKVCPWLCVYIVLEKFERLNGISQPSYFVRLGPKILL